jgi:hypothetical protein
VAIHPSGAASETSRYPDHEESRGLERATRRGTEPEPRPRLPAAGHGTSAVRSNTASILEHAIQAD